MPGWGTNDQPASTAPQGWGSGDQPVNAKNQQQQEQQPRGIGSTLLHAPLEALEGAGSGLVHTGLGAYDLARKIPGASKILPEVNPTLRQAGESPPTMAGKIGRFGEQAAEYMIPAGEVASATKALPLAGRALAQGATSGAVNAAQGGSPASIGTSAALGAAVPVAGAALKLIPNAERAGQKFQTVMQAAKNEPVDTTQASGPALRAMELNQRGAGPIPAPVNKFLQRTTAPNAAPMNFEEARDFSSNTGRLSAAENARMNPQMKAQVAGLAKALSEANQDAAERAGVGPLFKSAMTEYRRAMQIRGAKDAAGKIAKSTAAKIIGGAGLGIGGYAAARAIGLGNH
jgi:hypothetical protein